MLRHPILRTSIVLFLCAAMISPLKGNPNGPVVTAGNITITSGPGSMTINQADMRGIIHWQDFSIGAGELTQFVQPGAGAATLNRVVGGIPSSLLGTLQANGHVFLINPNGILVGPTGVVNTAGFIASALDVPDAEFLAGGDMNFSGNSMAGVVNLGVITATAGDVALLGNNVTNAGTINAPNGVAVLAAGNDILYQPLGDEKVVVRSSLGGAAGATNSGTISAAQAELKAAGGNVYSLAVNNSGTVAATGISTRGGRVILGADGGTVQNSGRLSAKNADGSGGAVRMSAGATGTSTNSGVIDAAASDVTKPGGTVEITGGTVTLASTSQIDASGASGGTVIVGGVPPTSPLASTTSTAPAANASGSTNTSGTATAAATTIAPSQLTPAQQTTIEMGSRILVNATAPVGNGGNIVVWSEQQTRAGGVYEAKGGEFGGNGGLIETSGKLGLTIAPGTVVNSSAPRGQAGTWLLDPVGIQVTNTAGGLPGPTHTQNANVNNVTASDVLASLTTGTNVTIQTTSAFPAGNRDIVVDAALPLLAANPTVALSLISAGGIVINQQIGGTNAPLSLNLTASAGSIEVSNTGSILAKTIYANASGSITLAGNVKALGGTMLLLSNQDIIFAGGTVESPVVDLRAGAKIFSNSAGKVITADNLALRTGPQGVGSAAVPLGTSVTRLEALVGFVASSPVAGGVFIANTGVTTLNIGGVDAALSGVQVPIDSAYKDISINTSGSLLIGEANGDRVTGPADISLGSSGDLKVFNNSLNSVRSHFGTVTLSASGNMEIGEFFSGQTATIRGGTGVNLLPGGNLAIRSGSVVQADGTGEVFIMGGAVVGVLGVIQTNGGAVNIFTGPNTSFVTNSGAVAVINTAFNGATGGDITINADNIDITSPINAGNRTVTIKPVVANRSVDLGTEVNGKISLTDAELSRITANQVNIQAGASGGDITVTAPLAHPASNGMGLFTPVGRVDINSTLNRGAGTVGIFTDTGIGGAGQLSASQVFLYSNSGDINYAGQIITNTLGFHALGNVSLQNPANDIVSIGASNGGNGFGGIAITDGAGNLTINGAVDSTGAILGIKTAGNLYIEPGASLNSQFLVQLDISTGNLVNLGGAGAITVPVGGRYVVYERDPFGSHNKGGLTAPDFNPAVRITDLNNDPLGAGSVFYYTSLTPPSTSGGSGGTSGGAAGGRSGGDAPSGFVLSTPRQFSSTTETIAAFEKRISSLTVRELNRLADDPKIVADPVKLLMVVKLAASKSGLDVTKFRFNALTEAEQREIEQQAAARKREELELAGVDQLAVQVFQRASDVVGQALALTAKLDAEGLGYGTSTSAYVDGIKSALADYNEKAASGRYSAEALRMVLEENVEREIVRLATFNESMIVANGSLVESKLNALAQTLGKQTSIKMTGEIQDALMGRNGINTVFANKVNLTNLTLSQIKQLSGSQITRVLAVNGAPLSQVQLAAAANTIMSEKQFGDIVRASGGLLTSAQFSTLVAAGAGNLTINQMVAAGGMNLVAAGGMNFWVRDASGKMWEGATMKLNDLVKLIGNDGSTLIGNDGSTLIGNDGSTLIGNDGSTLVAAGGLNLVAAGGMNFVSGILALIGNDGSTLVGMDGGSILSHNGGTLAGSLLQNAGGILSHNGGTLGGVPLNQAGVLSHNGSTLQGFSNGSNAVQIQRGSN